MELRQIEYFSLVARHGSFTRAAAEVGVAQPALSQQIGRLEAELGVPVFDRTRRPILLTEAGHALLARVERVLVEVRLARAEMREFAGLGRGRLVIGTLPALAALWLPEVVGRFHARYGGVEVIVRDDHSDALGRLLAAGELDVAVLHVVPGLRRLDQLSPEITVKELFEEEMVLVVPPGHPLAGRRSADLARLSHEPFVTVSGALGLTHTLVEGAAQAGFSPAVSVRAPNVTALRGLVAAGLGLAVIPRLVAEAPGSPVAVVPLRPRLPSHTAAVAWRAGFHSPAVAALVDVLVEHVAATDPAGRRRAGSGRR